MKGRLAKYLPLLVIWLPLLINAGHVVGFTAWTTWLSFTPSDLLPEYDWAGIRAYRAVLRSENTEVAYINLLLYGVGFVGLTTLAGFVLAVLIDQRIRAENLLRTIYLYPLAVSFVVTGTVWSWLFNPGQGIQKFVRSLGWTDFRFDWIIDRDLARRGLRHGAVPGRAALDRSRPAQGGADRWRGAVALLPAHRRTRRVAD